MGVQRSAQARQLGIYRHGRSPDSRWKALLKETIDLLQLQQGSHNKRVKEDPEKKINLDPKNHQLIKVNGEKYNFTKSLYRGMIPSCDICSSTFTTVGALDSHTMTNHAVINHDGQSFEDAQNIMEEKGSGRIISNPSDSIENDDEMYKCVFTKILSFATT